MAAAAFLTTTMPRIICGTSLMVVPLIGKFCTARTVWIP